ncbi:senescence-associated protein [Penicillium chermesinum]|nr:senescence-associated protein [Penicillium chermesinum]KAJ6141367.1 senescence-associated protein [Penicillium chermesinum]
MIGRADIEGSKSNVAMNAWLPQASSVIPADCDGRSPHRLLRGPMLAGKFNPCGNFSGTSSLKFRGTKGSIGHTFMVCIHTENQNQGDFYPFVLLEISVLHESPLGHLRCCLTDVPPQPNSPPDNVFNPDRPAKDLNARRWAVKPSSASLNK